MNIENFDISVYLPDTLEYFFECEVFPDCVCSEEYKTSSCQDCCIYLRCSSCLFRHECDNLEKCFEKNRKN